MTEAAGSRSASGREMPHSVQVSEAAGAVYSFGPEADNRVLARTGYDPRAFGTSAIVWEGMTQAEIDSDIENAWADHEYEPWRQKQDEIEACWNNLGQITRGDLAGHLETIRVRSALDRLNAGISIGLDIDMELKEIPAAEWAVEYDLVTDPKPSIREASLEEKIWVVREFNETIARIARSQWSTTAHDSRRLSAEAGKVEVHDEDEVNAARDGDALSNEFDPYARLDVADAAAFE
jgi:hypothetical protein